MTTEMNELRRKRLQSLVEEEGGPKEFCEKRHSDSADKPINPDQIYQIINGRRNFGEKAARNMEKRAGLPHLYFDDPELTPETEIFKESDPTYKKIMKALQEKPRDQVNVNTLRVIEMLLKGDQDLATKTEGIITFVEQQRANYSATDTNKEINKKTNNKE